MTEKTEAHASQAQTKNLTPAPGARLLWKAVEPRHHAMAETIGAEQGKYEYQAFVLSLLEAVDGAVMTTERRAGLSKETVAAAVADFESRWGVESPQNRGTS